VLPAQAAAPSAGEGVEALVAEVSVGGVEALVAEVSVGGVEALVAEVSVGGVEALVAEVSVGGVDAAAAALKRRQQMDRANKRRREKTAAFAAARVLPAAPSAGEGVDAGVKLTMDEVGPLPSKKKKADAASVWVTDQHFCSLEPYYKHL
jgi:hypothetical protein